MCAAGPKSKINSQPRVTPPAVAQEEAQCRYGLLGEYFVYVGDNVPTQVETGLVCWRQRPRLPSWQLW